MVLSKADLEYLAKCVFCVQGLLFDRNERLM